jgi:hypothetical protein
LCGVTGSKHRRSGYDSGDRERSGDEAVVATLPLGSVGFERDLTDKGEKQ